MLRNMNPLSLRRDHRLSTRKNRRGATAVEFAITAPIVFLFFFAAFEFCRVAMIRHTADNAVYEAARVAIVPGGTAAEATTEAERVLATVGASDFAITVTPATIVKATPEVTVRISVPLDQNSFIPNQFFNGKTVVRELTMQREGV